jgi:hypothetical protein
MKSVTPDNQVDRDNPRCPPKIIHGPLALYDLTPSGVAFSTSRTPDHARLSPRFREIT